MVSTGVRAGRASMGLSRRGARPAPGPLGVASGGTDDPGPSWGRLEAPQRRGQLWIVRGDPAGGLLSHSWPNSRLQSFAEIESGGNASPSSSSRPSLNA